MKRFVLAAALMMTASTLGYAQYRDDLLGMTRKEFKCLTDNVYHEARGESFRGQLLVAKTTINRSKKYGHDICKVVHAPGQFSWTASAPLGTYEKDAYTLAAKAAYLGSTITSDALYFHANYVKPSWAKTKTLVEVEGNHLFYK